MNKKTIIPTRSWTSQASPSSSSARSPVRDGRRGGFLRDGANSKQIV